MNWDTFAGIAPADNPQFVVAIMVDNPAHGLEGGDVAAPLYHEIATYELQHAHIPPTGSQSRHVPLQVCDAVNPGEQPQYRVLTCRMRSPNTVDTVPRPVRVEPTRLSMLAELAGGRLTGPDAVITGITASSSRCIPATCSPHWPGGPATVHASPPTRSRRAPSPS